MTNKVFYFFLFFRLLIFGQYAPDANTSGTTAISKNSDLFVNWASGIEITRGYLNIQDKNFEIEGSNKVSFGNKNNALGVAQGNSSHVVSLGDSGVAILTFPYPIKNEKGPDFGIFENSFSNTFLELAHVEVSSDGINFIRFPSHSLINTEIQINGFGNLDPTKINNLAGKYKQGFATPFDLSDLLDSLNVLDMNNITHIKLIDVVGSLNPNFGTKDSSQTLINDPFPTPFKTGGFDLDAIGVIHQNFSASIDKIKKQSNFFVYPTIFQTKTNINSLLTIKEIKIYNMLGQNIPFRMVGNQIVINRYFRTRQIVIHIITKAGDNHTIKVIQTE